MLGTGRNEPELQKKEKTTEKELELCGAAHGRIQRKGVKDFWITRS